MNKKPPNQIKTGQFATNDEMQHDRIDGAGRVRNMLVDKKEGKITIESFLVALNTRIPQETIIEQIEQSLLKGFGKSRDHAIDLWLELNQLRGASGTVEQHFHLPTHVGVVNLGGVAQMIGSLPPTVSVQELSNVARSLGSPAATDGATSVGPEPDSEEEETGQTEEG